MISTVKFSRVQKTAVAVEHPDEWEDAQVRAAAHARMVDIAGMASWYDGPSRTKIEGLSIGEDPAEAEDEEDHEDGKDVPTRYHPDPVSLTDEDLADGEAMMAGMEAEAPAKDEAAEEPASGEVAHG